MNSRSLPRTSFVRTMFRNLLRMLCGQLLSAALLFGLCQPGLAQYEALWLGPEEPAAPALPAGGVTIFQNVRIFDGKNAALSAPSSVLVRGNIIEQISANPAATEAGAGVYVTNANGRVLMPGLGRALAYVHGGGVSRDPHDRRSRLPQLVGCATGRGDADEGFTTIRDLGGLVFGFKRAIDEGVTVGPRISPSVR
jgi:imidazolonepropionase-like amidohydrolase